MQGASKGPGPSLAKRGHFSIKRPFTESLEGPGGPINLFFTESLEGCGPRFCQFWLFLYKAVLYKEPRRARTQIWPILAISVFSGPLQRASKGPGPDLASFCYCCMKRFLQTASKGPGPNGAKFGYFCIKRPSYRQPRRPWAQIWSILAISVLSGPLQRALKGPGPDFANFGYFRIELSFTESLEGPGPCFLPILVISVLSGPLQRASKGPGPDLANFGYFCI